jgi:hypothetical protein
LKNSKLDLRSAVFRPKKSFEHSTKCDRRSSEQPDHQFRIKQQEKQQPPKINPRRTDFSLNRPNRRARNSLKHFSVCCQAQLLFLRTSFVTFLVRNSSCSANQVSESICQHLLKQHIKQMRTPGHWKRTERVQKCLGDCLNEQMQCCRESAQIGSRLTRHGSQIWTDFQPISCF